MLKIEKHGTTESNIYIKCVVLVVRIEVTVYFVVTGKWNTHLSLSHSMIWWLRVALNSPALWALQSFFTNKRQQHTEREKKPVTNEKRRSLHWSFWFWLEHLAKEFLCCAHFHLMWAHVFWKIICFVRNSGSPSTGFAFFSPLNPCFVQSIKIFTWFFYVPPSLWFAAHGFFSFRSLINNLFNCFNSIESSKMTFIWNDFVWFLCSLSLTCVWLCDNI